MFKQLLIALLFLFTGCATVKKSYTETKRDSVGYSKLDSSWITRKLVDVRVPGAVTAGVNFDSLRLSWLASGGGQIPPQIVNQTFTIKDTSGRAELRYWFDASGKMYAECAAKDVTIQALVEQNNRLIKEAGSKTQNHEINKSKTVRRFPVWMYVAGVAFFLLLLLAAFLWLAKRTSKATIAGAVASTIMKSVS